MLIFVMCFSVIHLWYSSTQFKTTDFGDRMRIFSTSVSTRCVNSVCVNAITWSVFPGNESKNILIISLGNSLGFVYVRAEYKQLCEHRRCQHLKLIEFLCRVKHSRRKQERWKVVYVYKQKMSERKYWTKTKKPKWHTHCVCQTFVSFTLSTISILSGDIYSESERDATIHGTHFGGFW